MPSANVGRIGGTREDALTPVFVGGMGRGGTTLLLRLLDSHPSLAVFPSEVQLYLALGNRALTRWILRLAEVFDWFSLAQLIGTRSVAWLALRGPSTLAARLRIWVGEFPRVPSDPEGTVEHAVQGVSGPHEYWRAVLQLFQLTTQTSIDGKRYWIEKTPRNERYAGANDRLLGGSCRFIHVLRDPRDVIASSLLMRGLEPGERRDHEVFRLCYLWSRSLQWCRYNLRVYGKRHHVVRYEDTARRTADVMRGICEFLDIPMTNAVLVATRLGDPTAPNTSYEALAVSAGCVAQSQVGRFVEILSESESDLVEGLLHGQMAACGYAPRRAAGFPGSLGLRGLPPSIRRRPKLVFQAWKIVRAQSAYAGIRLPPRSRELARPSGFSLV